MSQSNRIFWFRKLPVKELEVMYLEKKFARSLFDCYFHLFIVEEVFKLVLIYMAILLLMIKEKYLYMLTSCKDAV